jgi:hypothetical protein
MTYKEGSDPSFEEEVDKSLEYLIELGIIESVIMSDGEIGYRLTEKGWQVHRDIQERKNQIN